MENGHSWSSIKKYTLAEIGTFYKVIVLSERNKKIEMLSNIWMGNNLNNEGINKVISDFGVKLNPKDNEPSYEEVKSDWKKLASRLRGL